MTALGRLVKTTAFKLSMITILVFIGLSLSMFLFISKNTDDLMRDQVIQTVDADVNGLTEPYAFGGITGLAQAIERRVRQPNANLYLLVDFAGNLISGNISHLPTAVLDKADGEIHVVNYQRLNERSDESARGQEKSYNAVVRVFKLPGNFRLLVGRDLEEQDRLHGLLGDALKLWLVGMVVLAAAIWFFISRRMLARMDGITKSSQQIMAGNLSRRIEVTGSGDEFDRLAISLNQMLERIEELLRGLKDVSDNIAHDLKTPLTRMRGRVEGALRDHKDEAGLRGALEETLVETDELINTFNALLRIARVEAGSEGVKMENLPLSSVAEDLCELYEPVAEDQGVVFHSSIDTGTVVLGDRQLLSQAVANLIENALKYGGSIDEAKPSEVNVSLYSRDQTAVLEVADNGTGIPEDERERVCERFVRLDHSRTEPGSGLGLALIKAVAGVHHGELELASGNPGLIARLVLPLARESTSGGDDGGQRELSSAPS
ncbi:HAMP domain-containing sensor histidine kinase [Pseudovibrio exalbescens]|uniref:sensor histidine kinase n=1 Tax=Pseudovibrio exalbescens TaxID=197461 RepID=UPI0023662250|nr:HAMP domain-containing sensor histidine kinase [Pseudovibrio exalbescens]MDD7909122.1 HAMP domain-containing sensor histidine kinase [Pseudovibrio exalbescens]